MSLPKVQELRSRVKTRVAEVRTRVRAQGLAGQQMRLGGGALVEQARRRADMVASRVAERRPKGVIPMVKELRLGGRVRELFGDRAITDLSVERDASAIGRPAYPFDGRDMSVFVE